MTDAPDVDPGLLPGADAPDDRTSSVVIGRFQPPSPVPRSPGHRAQTARTGAISLASRSRQRAPTRVGAAPWHRPAPWARRDQLHARPKGTRDAPSVPESQVMRRNRPPDFAELLPASESTGRTPSHSNAGTGRQAGETRAGSVLCHAPARRTGAAPRTGAGKITRCLTGCSPSTLARRAWPTALVSTSAPGRRRRSSGVIGAMSRGCRTPVAAGLETT
jgi:hypothetical protein